jgi:cyclase
MGDRNGEYMVKKRLIPCLFLKNGLLVRSEGFCNHQILGDPLHQVDRLNSWQADEVVYIDISDDEEYDLRRDDMKVKGLNTLHGIIKQVSKRCFVPLTVGGNLRTIEEIEARLRCGADKVVINTAAHRDPTFITRAADRFGKQCIIVGIDVLGGVNGRIYCDNGRIEINHSPLDWAKKVEAHGAGEIFLNSIDRDGTGQGYDIELIKQITSAVKIPVIACGGVGNFTHFVEGIVSGGASGVAAGNIFNYTENCVLRAKKALAVAGVDIREVKKHV